MAERRYITGPIEARAVDSKMTIAGHAATFDQPYELWGFREQIARGAFKKSLKEANVAALWNHDPNVVLGRNKNGTLRLAEDEMGLYYEVDLPDTQAARDLYTLIERGDIDQSSFSFEIVKETWDYPKEQGQGLPLRTIREVRLWDVSPVTYPANPSTDVDVARAVRSLADALGLDATHADSVPDLLARIASDATTQEPESEPVVGHSDTTQEPELEQPDFHLIGT